MKRTRATDWDEVLAAVRAGAERPRTPDEEAALLDERARRLARTVDRGERRAGLEVVTFEISHERLALPTRHLLEVLRLTAVTPVPRTPPFVLGVTNNRGAILAVFDLRALLGMRAAGLTDRSRVLVLGRDEPELGLVVDRVIEVLELDEDTLVPPPAGSAGHVKSVTTAGVALLDGDALLEDPRLVIGDAGPDGTGREAR